MNAYEKIYAALTDGRDDAWKKRVDETLARFKAQGMSPTQAIKHTAMELNMERETLDLEAIFLKAYQTRGGEALFNVVVDGMAMPVSGERSVQLPEYPTLMTIKNAARVKNLMTKKTWLEIDDKSEIVVKGGASPEELIKHAKMVGDVSDGEFALLLGTVIELVAWKEPAVTPDGVNLKINFRSGDMRTGCFVTDFDFLNGVLPSRTDQRKMKELADAGEWNEAIRFFNEVCGENRDFSIPGVDVLVYGKVADNNYTDKRTGEERKGKNVKITVGGFIYSVDLLYELLNPEAKKEGESTTASLEAFSKVGNDGNADGGVKPPTPEKFVDETEKKALDNGLAAIYKAEAAKAEVEIPDVMSVEETILGLLNEAKDGLPPQELLNRVKVNAEELSQKLTALHKAGKVQLKDGKFYAKRKK